MVQKIIFKKFCTGLIIGLMKDLVGLLNQSSLNTLTFQRTDHKKVMKKQFNKNVTITEEEDEQYQSSNTCWIC